MHYRWSPIACPDPLQTRPHPPSSTSSHSTPHTHTIKEPISKKNGSNNSTVSKKLPKLEEGEERREQDKDGGRRGVEETKAEKSTVSDNNDPLKDNAKGGAYWNSYFCKGMYTICSQFIVLYAHIRHNQPSRE